MRPSSIQMARVQRRRTSATEDYTEIGPIGYAGRPIRFLLPPMSVTTLSVLPD